MVKKIIIALLLSACPALVFSDSIMCISGDVKSDGVIVSADNFKRSELLLKLAGMLEENHDEYFGSVAEYGKKLSFFNAKGRLAGERFYPYCNWLSDFYSRTARESGVSIDGSANPTDFIKVRDTGIGLKETVVLGERAINETADNVVLIARELKGVRLGEGAEKLPATGLVIGKNCDRVLGPGHAHERMTSGGVRYFSKKFRFSIVSEWKTTHKERMFSNPAIVDRVRDENSGNLKKAYGGGYSSSGDWLILRTAEPLMDNCDNVSINLGNQELCNEPGDKVFLRGFHADLVSDEGGNLSDLARKPVSHNCHLFPPEMISVDGFDSDISVFRMSHTCKTSVVSSGAPVMCRKAGGAVNLIGIHVSHGDYFNFLVPLSEGSLNKILREVLN